MFCKGKYNSFEFIDSKQMAKHACTTHKHSHLGIKNLKEYINFGEWKNHFPFSMIWFSKIKIC